MDTTRRKVMLVAAAVLLVMGWVLFAVLRPAPEPSYQGKTLSEWLWIYATPPNSEIQLQAENAIRQIGTNGIPYYLEWIQYEIPAWRLKLTPAPGRLDGQDVPWLTTDWNIVRADTVPRAFGILGAQAKGAIPTLIQIIHKPGSVKSLWALRAAKAMSAIGTEAIPSFAALFTNQNVVIRRAASLVMVEMPGTSAQTAIPALVKAMTDKDFSVRTLASNALFKIAPEVRTNAPVK